MSGYPPPSLADTDVPKKVEECDRMNSSHLRIYTGPAEESDSLRLFSDKESPKSINVQLGEVLPLLVDAVRSERTWLRDFETEEITISTDLYEVILAYQHYRRPSA
jgi:hypothetical protein